LSYDQRPSISCDRLYARRAACCHRHYRRAGGTAVAGGASGPRSGSADELPEQPAAAWPGTAQFSRRLRRLSARPRQRDGDFLLLAAVYSALRRAEDLFERYRFDLRWDDANTNDNGVIQTTIKIFICPSCPYRKYDRAPIDYPPPNQITTPNSFLTRLPNPDSTFPGVLGKDVRRRLADITDGTSNTLLLAESAGRDPLYQMGKFVSLAGGGRGSWGNPGNVINLTGFNPASSTLPGPCAANCTNNNEIYSFHAGSANVLLCDASVRGMRANVPLQIVSDLITRPTASRFRRMHFDNPIHEGEQSV